MHYIIESILVGIYTLFIYLPLWFLIQNLWIRFFLLGFFKHLLGSILNIHHYYCNYGYACNKSKNEERGNYIYDRSNILMESFLEGIYFLTTGYLFFVWYKKGPFFFVFLLALFTHLFFEWAGIHQYVCKYKCIKIKKNKKL